MACNILLQTGGRLQLQTGGFLLLENCQIDDVTLLGGKAYSKDKKYEGVYQTAWQKYKISQEKLEALNKQIVKTQQIVDNANGVDVGFEAAKANARKNEQIAKAQEEIKQLLSQKAALVRLIDEEEAILVLLLSMPFVH